MKKSIAILLFLTVISLVTSQVSKSSKPKGTVLKDTTKTSKIVQIPQLNQTDTLQFDKGVYKSYKKNAHASYYADKFHGKKTASGKKFDMHKLTAAHKKLPFGTMVKVTNEANGKSVIVEINDRGPFVKTREIDLSKKAFMEITQNKSSGAMKVTIEVAQN